MFGGHREEISVVGCHVQRLLCLRSGFNPIEITFYGRGFVQSSPVFQVQSARVMNLNPNLQMRGFPSLSHTPDQKRNETRMGELIWADLIQRKAIQDGPISRSSV